MVTVCTSPSPIASVETIDHRPPVWRPRLSASSGCRPRSSPASAGSLMWLSTERKIFSKHRVASPSGASGDCRRLEGTDGLSEPHTPSGNRICTQCRWLMRAGWTAQELLTSFRRSSARWRSCLAPAASSTSGWVTGHLVARRRRAFSRAQGAEAAVAGRGCPRTPARPFGHLIRRSQRDGHSSRPVGSPRSKHEGVRLGTVRRLPRGVKKTEYAARDYFDVWLPELAPALRSCRGPCRRSGRPPAGRRSSAGTGAKCAGRSPPGSCRSSPRFREPRVFRSAAIAKTANDAIGRCCGTCSRRPTRRWR